MIFVTTVTCARNIYGKFTSFYIDTGVFTAERVTLTSDNGDRRLPIKFSVVTLLNPKIVQNLFASRVPAEQKVLLFIGIARVIRTFIET